MVALNRCATRDELARLLSGSPPQENVPIVQHMDHCVKCQKNLSDLVASHEAWEVGREMLMRSASVLSAEHPPDADDRREQAAAASSSDEFQALRSVNSHPARAVPLTGGARKTHGREPFVLGNYRILKTIGFGGMATVYHGQDMELNRVVAIKILHEHLAATGASRQRFLKEAQAAAAIVHPNVIPIYGVHLSEGRPYLAMPLISGGSLQQRIDREGPLPLADWLNIALQIAEALQAAHSKGVVHRDVKPANILLEDGNNRIILTDFGLARTLDDAHQTASGLISGTPAYMSPEQARGERGDARSDLYSLGCVLFAMATGHAPYQASSTFKMLRVVDESNFPSVHRFQEQLPDWTDRLIGLLVSRDANQRLGSAAETAHLIRDCLLHCNNNSLPLPKQIVAPKLSRSQQFIVWLSRNALGAISLALLFCILVVVAAMRRSHPQTEAVATSQVEVASQDAAPVRANRTPDALPLEMAPMVDAPAQPWLIFEEIQMLKQHFDKVLNKPIFQ